MAQTSTSTSTRSNASRFNPYHNSYEWPSHWRALIFRISEIQTEDGQKYRVWPRNPEYDEMVNTLGNDLPFNIILPLIHLDPVEFDTLEDVHAWADVLWRVSR